MALFCVGGAAAAEPRAEPAKERGEVVWYTAMNVPDAEAVRQPFNERYPFIKVTLLRSTGEKVRTRSSAAAITCLRAYSWRGNFRSRSCTRTRWRRKRRTARRSTG